MTDMRRLIRIVEATLYRGDASKIDLFDQSKSAQWFLLYTHGTYLTDSEAVAADYTLKDGVNTVFRDKSDNKVKTPKVLLRLYILDIANKNGLPEAVDAVRKKWEYKYYEDPAAFNANRKDMEDGLAKETALATAKFFRHAKAKVKALSADLRLVKLTTGELVIVSKGREGYVTKFEVPDDYLAKTLHTDQPLPVEVLEGVKKIFEGEHMVGQKLDMRDRDNEFQTFDDWVKLYQTVGVPFAWGEDDDGKDRIVGGKGELPDLESIWHGTYHGGCVLYDKNSVNKLIALLQGLGYVGLEYDGGKRVGSHVRGGGGVLHRAFVFWNDDDINSFRVDATKVTDPEFDANHIRSVRY